MLEILQASYFYIENDLSAEVIAACAVDDHLDYRLDKNCLSDDISCNFGDHS
jgi:hypothetical protein